jgi:hypothetical protein
MCSMCHQRATGAEWLQVDREPPCQGRELNACIRHTERLGAPVTSMMRSSWFMVEVPGKMGLPPSSSPRMHPALRQVAAVQGSSW